MLIFILAALNLLIFRSDTQAIWHVEKVDSTGDVGWYTSIAVDKNNYVHIAYYDYTNNDLKYAKGNGAGWTVSTVDTAGGVSSSIAVDSNNNPQISYIASGSLKCARWTGLAWSLTTVGSADSTFCTSLAIDNNGRGHVSYSYNGLKYAAYNGATWTISSPGGVNDAMDSSLALDSSGYPYISYIPNSDDDVHTLRWTGAGWTALSTIVDAAYWLSLKLDSGNNRHICFQNWANNDLKYWSAGVSQTIDSANETGYWPSLALDSGNNPHLSYHDNTNWDLKYTKWTGSAWDIQTVDSIGGVGFCTSIALDTGGNPRISYYDSANKDLKYAKWVPGSYQISGYIKTASGTALSDVTVFLTGDVTANSLTSSSGYYEFGSAPAGSFVVTPSASGWNFTPSQQVYSGLSSNQSGQNFTGSSSSGYFIRGYAIDTAGYAVEGVLVSLSGRQTGSYTTGSNGYYEFTNLPGGSYTVTPSKSGSIFSPENRTYTTLSADQDSQQFTTDAQNLSYYIKGYLKDSNNLPISAATVSLTGSKTLSYTTAVDGYYEFLDLPFGDYTTTPAKSGWTFLPVTNNYQSLHSYPENQNFFGLFGPLESTVKIVGNLFNPAQGQKTTIWLNLTKSSKITIKIYTIDGLLIKELYDDTVEAGTQAIEWAGLNEEQETVSSGIYFVAMEIDGVKQIKKVCLIR